MTMEINGYNAANIIDRSATTENNQVSDANAPEGVADVSGILPGTGVTVTDGVQGDARTERTSGLAGVPQIDEPTRQPNAGELLEKLIAYLRLDDEEQQLRVAKQRTEANKASIEAEHKARTEKLNLFLALLGDKEALASLDPEKRRLVERLVGKLDRAMRTGGFFSGFIAACALQDFLEEVMGAYVSFRDVRRFIEDLQDAFDSRGSRMSAKALVATAILGVIAGVGSLKTDGLGHVDRIALRTSMKLAVAAAVMAAKDADRANNPSMRERGAEDGRDLAKFVAMMQERLDENAEMMDQILVQLSAGIAGALDLIAAANDTDSQIVLSNVQMA